MGQALGKHSAIDFQGKDWFGLNAPPVTGQQFTVVAVVTDRPAGGPKGSHRNLVGNWNGGRGNSTTSIFLGTTAAAKGARSVRLTDAFALRDTLVLAKPTVPFVLTGIAESSNARVFQNGRLLDQLGAALPGRKLDTDWTIGRQGTLDSEYWDGLVAELLVWDRALTEDELAKVWKHLGSKYDVVDQGRPRQPLTVAAARQQALVQVCRVILNLNEFVYTD